MAKSSIHIRPVQGNSEIHNTRQMKLDYVREDLSHKNFSYSAEKVSDRLAKIKTEHKAKTGRKLQKNATPIREGVFLFKANQKPQEVWNALKQIDKEFGVRPFQMHLHYDEGHWSKEGEWKQNLHGHVLFDWTDKNTGRMIRLGKHDMAKMQTILANGLDMERGQSSDKKHLSSIAWKTEKEKEKLQAITKDYQEQEKLLQEIKGTLEEIIEQNKKSHTYKIKKASNVNIKPSEINDANEKVVKDLFNQMKALQMKLNVKDWDDRDRERIKEDARQRVMIAQERQRKAEDKVKSLQQLQKKYNQLERAVALLVVKKDPEKLKKYVDNNKDRVLTRLDEVKQMEKQKEREREIKERNRKGRGGFSR